MIDDRIKALSERISRERPPPALVQRLLVALVEELVAERVEPPLVVFHPFDAGVPIEEGIRLHIEGLEERLNAIHAYAKKRGYTDIVEAFEGLAYG